MSIWESDWAILVYIVGGYGLIFYIAMRIGKYTGSRYRARWEKYLKEKLAKKINEGKVSLDADSIIKNHNKIEADFDYVDAKPFIRWIKGMEIPNEDE